ncbi:Condensin-2 complex subunit H2 [Phytophthora pseudosyringae]|uniref:Condensin-2 complex subunit H2 n=1 Tax=Phytophthora pseudosyringae TaxID=221518 RepID=A0A8T1VGL7_9STRA|nr:Condensin-2 complex subunit H2 [Phytophthora pseudosyringae]
MSEGRLQHLLQPIRDLSKNWNIDLASELEEYMDKLENLNIAFDPEDGASITGDGEGAGVMNFAEAALLIQGTSVIYSRKVEYLHALVYQTLAHLSKQQDDRQQRQQSGETGDAQNEDEDGDAGASVFSNPLPLYDELEEAKPTHITLKRAKQEDEETESDRRRKRKEAKALNRSKNNIQASIALMGSLVPDERDHGETFKLLSCNLHASGVLLLDEASKKYLRAGQQAAGEQSLAFGETPGRHGGMWVAADGESPATALNFDDMDANDVDDGNDNGFDDKPDYEYDAGEPVQDAPMGDAADQVQQEETAMEEPFRRATRSAAPLPAGEKDPWAPLDAYDASTSVARPFKKGRSYPRVPAYKKKKPGPAALSNKEGVVGMDDDAEQDGISDPAFQDRFFMGSNGPQWASWVWTETASENPLEKTCKRTFCKAPLLVKSCDALWQREAKWRSIMRRCEAREKQSAQAMLLREQAMEEEEADGNDQMQTLTLSSATARLDMAFRNDANANNDEDDSNGDDNDYDDGFDGGDWGQGNDMDDPMSSYETAAAAGSSGGPLTYEEVCRQHLASFMSGTEKYVRETDLSKKVSDWQDKLTPLLKQQDTHPPFDIHHYGREIIGRLEEEQKSASLDMHSKKTKRDKNKRARLDPASEEEERETVPFETLVGGKSQFEVCRLFLASLQLANNGNVELSHAHTAAEHGQVPFKMQLLSTVNAYEALQA